MNSNNTVPRPQTPPGGTWINFCWACAAGLDKTRQDKTRDKTRQETRDKRQDKRQDKTRQDSISTLFI